MWSNDAKHMYYIDTPTREVMEYAYDVTAGDELKDLYITTARIGTSMEELEHFPDAGMLFKISLQSEGVSSFCY